MSTLVSIITPCLNSEETIERTILSVLNQSYTNIQYIVIDGQSSDKTLEILNKYQTIDSRLHVVSEKDNSMTEALNRGLKLAYGDIIASVNADDWYEPNTVKHVVQLHQNHGFDCLMGKTQFISDTGKLLYITQPWLASCLLAWYVMGCLTPESSVFYSAKCINNIGYFNENLKYTQDFEYYLRIIKHYKIFYTNKVLSSFCVSANQYSSRLRSEMESEVLTFINYKFIRRILGGSSLSTPIRIFLAHRSYTLSQLYSHLSIFLQNHLKTYSYKATKSS